MSLFLFLFYLNDASEQTSIIPVCLLRNKLTNVWRKEGEEMRKGDDLVPRDWGCEG